MVYLAILAIGGLLSVYLYRVRVPRGLDRCTNEERARAIILAFVMGAVTYGGIGCLMYALL